MIGLVNPRIAIRKEREEKERAEMGRRGFIKTLAGATGALVLGAEAMDAYERLTYQKRLWPGWTSTPFRMTDVEMSHLSRVMLGGASTFTVDDVAILRKLGYRLPREQRTERVERMLAPFTGWRIT